MPGAWRNNCLPNNRGDNPNVSQQRAHNRQRTITDNVQRTPNSNPEGSKSNQWEKGFEAIVNMGEKSTMHSVFLPTAAMTVTPPPRNAVGTYCRKLSADKVRNRPHSVPLPKLSDAKHRRKKPSPDRQEGGMASDRRCEN